LQGEWRGGAIGLTVPFALVVDVKDGMPSKPHSSFDSSWSVEYHDRPEAGPLWIMFAPLAVYLVSFFLPFQTEIEYTTGFYAFVLGFCFWPIGWLSNVFFWITITLLAIGYGLPAILTSLLSILLALSFWGYLWPNPASRDEIYLAYFAWLSAHVLSLFMAIYATRLAYDPDLLLSHRPEKEDKNP
jgi:hypothetical protein